MLDITDDIAEEISFQSLEDDCRLLGSLLNDILHHEVGPDFIHALDRKRILAQVINQLSFMNICVCARARMHACMLII
jgi:hypothetical protein